MLDPKAFLLVPKLSIDIAVIEKADNVAVIACDMGWSDIGSWSAIANLTPPDVNGNRVDGHALLIDTENCFVRGNGRTVGMKDLIVVDAGDALPIAHAGQSQLVKQIKITDLSKIS